MKVNDIITISGGLIKAKITRSGVPLFVGWVLTNQCNGSCKYCHCWLNKNHEELITKDILSGIKQLKRMGAKFISFTGGEPLLREDIGNIIKYCKNKGMYVFVNTNGLLVEEKIEEIREADIIFLSLDGDEKINDFLRGRGSFAKTMYAARLLQKEGIKIGFSTVFTKYNIDELDFLINTAKKFKTNITFQPVTSYVLSGKESHNLIPETDQYRAAIDKLIKLKRNSRKHIGHSLSGLYYLRNWPATRSMNCSSGKIAMRIEVNGDITLCKYFYSYNPSKAINYLATGMEEAFSRLPKISCDRCWCAQRLEMNLLYNGNFSLLEAINNLRKFA